MLLVMCGVAWVAVGAAASAAEDKYDGIYIGKRSLVKGPSQCLAEESVTIIIKGDTVSFADSQEH